LQHVERLGAADFADDDAVRPHAQAIADEVALLDFAHAFEVGRPRFQPDDVLLLYLAGHGLASDQIMNNPDLTKDLQRQGLRDYKAQGVRSGMFFFAPAD
jgi:hypothetical protein